MIIARGLPLHARLRQRGFTLMETVLVIAVGLGLLIGGIMFYQAAERKAEAAKVAGMISALSADMRALHARGDALLSGAVPDVGSEAYGLDVTSNVKQLYSGSSQVFNYVETINVYRPLRSAPIPIYLDYDGPVAFTFRLFQSVSNSKLCQTLVALRTDAVFVRSASCENAIPSFPRVLFAFSP